MTNMEKKILKCCNKNFTDGERITTQLLDTNTKLTKQQIKLCVEYLNQKGYMRNLDIFAGGNVSFELTYLGRHYKEIQFEKVKHFLFTSIAVPVFVSLLTSVLYLWLFV